MAVEPRRRRRRRVSCGAEGHVRCARGGEGNRETARERSGALKLTTNPDRFSRPINQQRPHVNCARRPARARHRTQSSFIFGTREARGRRAEAESRFTARDRDGPRASGAEGGGGSERNRENE